MAAGIFQLQQQPSFGAIIISEMGTGIRIIFKFARDP